MELKEFSGENVEAATVKAESHFGVSRADLHIKVVADETSGLYSIGMERRAVILVRPKAGAPMAAPSMATPPMAAPEAAPEAESLYAPQRTAREGAPEGPGGPSTEASGKARELLEGILTRLPLDRPIDLADGETSDAVELVVRTDLQGFLVGSGGEVLAALTYLVNRMANRGAPATKRVVIEAEGYRSDRVASIEAEGYRSDRVASLERLALDRAREVRTRGEPARLEPMNSYDRRIIHLALQKVPGIKTESEGEGAHKSIVIHPVPER
jgi:spoIIIJ-associated protein